MRKLEVVLSNERIVPNSGLYLVNKILSRSDLISNINKVRSPKRSQPVIPNGDICKIAIGLLTLRKTDFECINEFSDDPEYLEYALELSGFPSESSYRNRLEDMGT